MKIFFLIPAYNEEQNLGELINRISRRMQNRDHDFEINVVDDGSSDDTARVVLESSKKYPVVYIRNQTNLGAGASFSKGFEEIFKKSNDNDIIITMEADNSGDLSALDKMIEHVSGKYDISLASCYAKGGRVLGCPPDRLFFSYTANKLFKIIFPIKGVSTYSSFYRAFKAVSIKKAFSAFSSQLITDKGFVCMAQMLIRLRWLKFDINEVPITLRVHLRKDKSKMNKSRTIQGYFNVIKEHVVLSLKEKKKIVSVYADSAN